MESYDKQDEHQYIYHLVQYFIDKVNLMVSNNIASCLAYNNKKKN